MPAREITFPGILLSIVLALLLAASNTYLALKVGILTSASIPAAVLAMSVMSWRRRTNVKEINLIQTSASAGEAIAGGIVYTAPALIIIQYWHNFGYWQNLGIALAGGILGILFSVPLRSILVHDPKLRFPEAQAITKLIQLIETEQRRSTERALWFGGLTGAVLELLQTGLQIVSAGLQKIFTLGNAYFGVGIGFSPVLLGAGYLIGTQVGFSLLIGAMSGWLIVTPLLSGFAVHGASGDAATWLGNMRYIGVGGILTAGVWTICTLLRPVVRGIYTSFRVFSSQRVATPKEERDFPMPYVLLGIVIAGIFVFFFLHDNLPLKDLSASPGSTGFLLGAALIFVLVIGFIFAAICGYFSGLVGVTASPGSAVVIGGLLLASFGLKEFLTFQHLIPNAQTTLSASALIIIIMSIVTGLACITNDNIQDLKVGNLVGSTPWKQQSMLFLGVIVAAAIVPLLMQLLFSVYGISNILPRPGMNPAHTLPAPVPTVIATVTQAFFQHDLPLNLLAVGMGIVIVFIILNLFLKKYKLQVSILSIGLGLYLPLLTSTALFIGSFIALIVRHSKKQPLASSQTSHRGIIFACGLVAGSTLLDVLLAIPFAITGNTDMFNLSRYLPYGNVLTQFLGIAGLLLLLLLFKRLENGTARR